MHIPGFHICNLLNALLATDANAARIQLFKHWTDWHDASKRHKRSLVVKVVRDACFKQPSVGKTRLKN